jgi:hypothetical protein
MLNDKVNDREVPESHKGISSVLAGAPGAAPEASRPILTPELVQTLGKEGNESYQDCKWGATVWEHVCCHVDMA